MFLFQETKDINLFQLEGCLTIAERKTSVSTYDFDFRQFFQVKSLRFANQTPPLILRTGAIGNYKDAFNHYQHMGFSPVNNPEEHLRASVLPEWYPIIKDLTIRSIWFEQLPDVETVEKELGWPVFIKGERQTNRHQLNTCVAHSREMFQTICELWKTDPILKWQKMVCRTFVHLEKSGEGLRTDVQVSTEFRAFTWHTTLLSIGPYWPQSHIRTLNGADEVKVLQLIKAVTSRINVPFLVIDVGRLTNGEWIVIELNDAQESGYAGNFPFQLWKKLTELLTSTQ